MKEIIRALALSLGADVCGFAAIDRFAGAPAGFHPADLYKNCKTVIVLGLALPFGLSKVNPRLIYHHYNELINIEIDRISLRLAKEVEARFGCAAVPLPCDNPYEYWDAEKREGRGLISMKHAAVCAGIGTLGKNTLLLSKTFGSLLNVGAILLDAALESDPLAASVCLSGCKKCEESCPVGAIQNGTVIQKLCREYTYDKTARGFSAGNCNRCRTACPAAFGTSK